MVEMGQLTDPEVILKDEMMVIGGEFAMDSIRQEVSLNIARQLACRKCEPVLRLDKFWKHHGSQKDRAQLQGTMVSRRREVFTQITNLLMQRFEEPHVELGTNACRLVERHKVVVREYPILDATPGYVAGQEIEWNSIDPRGRELDPLLGITECRWSRDRPSPVRRRSRTYGEVSAIHDHDWGSPSIGSATAWYGIPD